MRDDQLASSTRLYVRSFRLQFVFFSFSEKKTLMVQANG